MSLDQSASVLHVPYTFFPDEPGGTEVYVRGLIAEMRRLGFEGAVAAPGDKNDAYEYDGVSVHRFKKDTDSRLDYAYGQPDEIALHSFYALLQRLRPDIVHIHALTAAVSQKCIAAAHDIGARAVFTYHTPTVSCLRGSMMHMGVTPCDGVLAVKRCAVCTLHKHGVPPALGNVIARMPEAFGSTANQLHLNGKVVTALRMHALTAGIHARFRELSEKADCIVAVCQWVWDVLRANGVAQSKLVLCRQGYSTERARKAEAPPREGPLRLSYFGRLDFVKGVDLVIDALKRIPNANLTVDIYGIVQPGSETYASQLREAKDSRVRFHEPLPPYSVPGAMAWSDFVLVPSRGLETGPLVIYEAFASGAAVIGAPIGGIAELVTHEVDGILVKTNNAAEWARTMAALASDRARVNLLRAGVRPPRTMADVASEMAHHYRNLLTSHG